MSSCFEHLYISEDQVQPSLMRTFLIDKEDCAVMSRKRSLESGSCEGVDVLPNCKSLTVDQVHQSHIPQLKYKKLGSERRLSTLELPGTLAPADATCKVREQLVSSGKELVDRTERQTERKTDMRPPKVIREAVLGRMEADDRITSFGCEVWNGKYTAEQRTVVEMIHMDNDGKEVGAKVDKGALRVAKDKVVARHDEFKLAAHEREMEVQEESGGKITYGSSGICKISLACKNENDKSNMQCNYKETHQNKMHEVLTLNSLPDNYQADLCRDQVRKVLDLYKDTLERVRKDDKVKTNGKRKIGMQIYVDAAMQLKDHKKWLNVDKCFGALPGIEIGDQFQSRAELVIVGLHSKFLAGIDYKNMGGKICASSIVTSGHHGDKNHSSDVLIYVGEGGKPNRGSEKPEDQKLVRGNLALKNSTNDVPVRVIRRIQNVKAPELTLADSVSKFVYDGLYFVRKCWPEREHCGNLVYKFQLERIQGQQELPRWTTQNTLRKFNKATQCPIVLNDISNGEENMPVRVVNAIDCQKPPPFKYTTKMAYHSQQCVVSKSGGCDCLDGCSKETLCSCIVMSNGKVSIDNSVSIVKKDPIVYECGPCCKCPPGCKNRTSQHGVKLQLEVFKNTPTGWGVRSRNFISEGRFICEYVGDLLKYKEEEGRIDFDESAVDAGNSNDAKTVMFGNVARFIKHSCSPNLYAKCVLFDHEDMRRPHVMLFAARNIPPRKELTFDYKLPTTAPQQSLSVS
nr:PREDICTED: histone-lysine N-methyltransferase, H3 lysine-9 specific SUVH5-like [Daucus carota subsp. sativus]